MAARSINKSRDMDKLLQLVLEADDDADLSAAVEHFYVLGPGLKKEFCAILKALKADGLVVSCSDAPKGDKDLIREKLVNMAYFSKLGVGYSHTCSDEDVDAPGAAAGRASSGGGAAQRAAHGDAWDLVKRR